MKTERIRHELKVNAFLVTAIGPPQWLIKGGTHNRELVILLISKLQTFTTNFLLTFFESFSSEELVKWYLVWGPVRLLWNDLFLGSDKLGCEDGLHKELRLVLGVETKEMAVLWVD